MDRGVIRVGELKTRRAEFSEHSDPAFISFGGTTLYAKSQSILERAIAILQESLLWACGEHLILHRNALCKLVREKLEEDLNRSVVSALVGRLLSIGKLDALPCISVNSRLFSVIYRVDRALELEKSIHQAEHFLQKNGTVSPRELQNLCFPDRGWGTYAASTFILNHLVYLGHAVFLDNDLFAWPKEVEDAFRKVIH